MIKGGQNRQDRAIEGLQDDDLDRDPFVANLVKALVDEVDNGGKEPVRRATGLVVGLTGEWGLGKSSVLNLLAERLGSMDQVLVTKFNPWLFKGRDELVQAFFNALRRALGKGSGERFRAALSALDDYRSAIEKAGEKGALVIDLNGGGGAATAGWKWVKFGLGLLRRRPPRTPDEERASLERKIAATRSAIVVLIDELDRVEDDEVRAVAQLVKAVGDIKGISYLVAYDPSRVADALGRGTGSDRRISGEAYLEKIVQMPIPLRPLFYDDVGSLLTAALLRHGFELPEPRAEKPYKHEKAIYDLLIDEVKTPREVKRLAGSFQFFERIVRGEVCVWDVLGYSWIAAKSPSLRDRIAEQMEAMADDPGETEMLRRLSVRTDDRSKRRVETVTDVLGEAAVAHERLIAILFPRFKKDSQNAQGDRLARRRNLVRLLYLGNPPGLIPRAEIEHLWLLDAASLRDRLEELRSEDKIGPLLDRLVDLLPNLPASGDDNFWPTLSATLVRKEDWAAQRTNARELIDDAGATLWRLGQSGPKEAARVHNVMDALISTGDLLIAPWLLRKHLFAHKLTIHSKPGPSERDVLFNLKETKALLAREAPRYREALISGFVLRRLPDNEAMFVLGNADLIDTELRSCLTAQLDSIAAIASFAVVTVPPGYSSDRKSMEQFVDGDAVLERLAKLKVSEGMPEDPWLDVSVKRLEATLRDQDPDWGKSKLHGTEDDDEDDASEV